MTEKIFIAGGGGCVGHYLYDLLAKDSNYQLYFLLRSPEKVLFDTTLPNITVIRDDFANIEKHKDLLGEMDYAINLVADWGTTLGNYESPQKFFDILEKSKCKKILYFSTASILGYDTMVNDIMGDIGTPYIKGKYLMYKKIKESAVDQKTLILFPTWILGGDSKHPLSHGYNAINQVKHWFWLIRFFSIDLKFHYIHAKDIARITGHLLKSNKTNGEFVLGNPAINADTFIDEACRFFGLRRYFKLRLNPDLIVRIARLTGKELSPWDMHCIENRNLEFKTVNCGTFGMDSEFIKVQSLLEEATGALPKDSPKIFNSAR